MDSNTPDSADTESTEAPSPLPWSDETVWELVSGVMNMPDDAPDRNLYWHNASQGAALLMAALYVLAKEFEHMDNGEARPALVRKIVNLTMDHSDDIKAKVIEILL